VYSVWCSQKAVKEAYHVICKKCSEEKNVCAKCLEPVEEKIKYEFIWLFKSELFQKLIYLNKKLINLLLK